MTIFVENPLAILVLGSVLATFAAIVFLARRTGAALAALAAIVIATLLLLALERYVATDREQVEAGVMTVLAAMEANDLPGVLAQVDPAAAMIRRDVQTLMPLVKVEKARALGAVKVEVDSQTTAFSSFRAFLNGVHSSSGMQVGYFNQRVDVQWVKQGDRWLISGYTAYYDDQPIDAVSSARGNRPVPGR